MNMFLKAATIGTLACLAVPAFASTFEATRTNGAVGANLIATGAQHLVNVGGHVGSGLPIALRLAYADDSADPRTPGRYRGP